jgi:zinc protease
MKAGLSRRRAATAVPELPRVRSELPNGARLVVSPRAGAPVFAAQLHLRGGHSLDPPSREGTANLVGALLDQGTARRDDEAIAALLEPAGGHVSGDATGVAGMIEAGEWRLLLDLLCEMATSPAYPAERVALQRGRLLDRLRLDREEPRTQAVWLFRRLVYGNQWLGRPEHGDIESVERIHRSHLAAFHARNWCAARALLAVCGDVDPAEVERHVRRRLGRWKRGADLGPRPFDPPPLGPRSAVFTADRQQVHVYLGHLGVRRADPDYPALVVLDHVLGSGPGFTSRVTRRLRDELGLAYSVHASIASSAGVLPGTFSAYIGTSPKHVGTALAGFLEEIRRIREELVEPAELELARDYLLGSFALGFERAARRAQYTVFAERNELGDRHLQELCDAFAAVSAEDVRRAARAHLHPERSCVAAAGPITAAVLKRLVAAALGARARRPRPRAKRAARG